MKTILNIYIKRPLFWDVILIIMICLVYAGVTSKYDIKLNFKEDLVKSILSDLTNTSISLAGFVLASLTIIVTFKDNLTQKTPIPVNQTKKELEAIEIVQSNTDTGIALLFSSKHYGRIVGVFTWAVLIYLGLFLVLSLSKLFIGKIPTNFYEYLCIVPILLTALTIFRSVLVLYRIIKLQLKK